MVAFKSSSRRSSTVKVNNNKKSLSSSCVIVLLRAVFKRTVVGDSKTPYPHPDDDTRRTTYTPGFKPFTK